MLNRPNPIRDAVFFFNTKEEADLFGQFTKFLPANFAGCKIEIIEKDAAFDVVVAREIENLKTEAAQGPEHKANLYFLLTTGDFPSPEEKNLFITGNKDFSKADFVDSLLKEHKTVIEKKLFVSQYFSHHGSKSIKDAFVLEDYAEDFYKGKKYHLSGFGSGSSAGTGSEIENDPPILKVIATLCLMLKQKDFFKNIEYAQKAQDLFNNLSKQDASTLSYALLEYADSKKTKTVLEALSEDNNKLIPEGIRKASKDISDKEKKRAEAVNEFFEKETTFREQLKAFIKQFDDNKRQINDTLSPIESALLEEFLIPYRNLITNPFGKQPEGILASIREITNVLQKKEISKDFQNILQATANVNAFEIFLNIFERNYKSLYDQLNGPKKLLIHTPITPVQHGPRYEILLLAIVANVDKKNKHLYEPCKKALGIIVPKVQELNAAVPFADICNTIKRHLIIFKMLKNAADPVIPVLDNIIAAIDSLSGKTLSLAEKIQKLSEVKTKIANLKDPEFKSSIEGILKQLDESQEPLLINWIQSHPDEDPEGIIEKIDAETAVLLKDLALLSMPGLDKEVRTAEIVLDAYLTLAETGSEQIFIDQHKLNMDTWLSFLNELASVNKITKIKDQLKKVTDLTQVLPEGEKLRKLQEKETQLNDFLQTLDAIKDIIHKLDTHNKVQLAQPAAIVKKAYTAEDIADSKESIEGSHIRVLILLEVCKAIKLHAEGRRTGAVRILQSILDNPQNKAYFNQALPLGRSHRKFKDRIEKLLKEYRLDQAKKADALLEGNAIVPNRVMPGFTVAVKKLALEWEDMPHSDLSRIPKMPPPASHLSAWSNLEIDTLVAEIQKRIAMIREADFDDRVYRSLDDYALVKRIDLASTTPNMLVPYDPHEAEIQALRYLLGMLLIARNSPEVTEKKLYEESIQIYKEYALRYNETSDITQHSDATHALALSFMDILEKNLHISSDAASRQFLMARDLGTMLNKSPKPICTISQLNDGGSTESWAYSIPTGFELNDIETLLQHAKSYAHLDPSLANTWVDHFFAAHPITELAASAPPSARWLPLPANVQKLTTRVELPDGTASQMSMIRVGTLCPFDIKDKNTQEELAIQHLEELIKAQISASIAKYKEQYQLKTDDLVFIINYQTLLTPIIGQEKVPGLKDMKDNNARFVRLAKIALNRVKATYEGKQPNGVSLVFLHTNNAINKLASDTFNISYPEDRETRELKLKATANFFKSLPATAFKVPAKQTELHNLATLLEKQTAVVADENAMANFASDLQKGLVLNYDRNLQFELATRLRAAFYLRALLNKEEPYKNLSAWQRNIMQAALEYLCLGNQALTLTGCKSARDRTAIFYAAAKTMQEKPAAMNNWNILNAGILTTLQEGHPFRSMGHHVGIVKVGDVHKDLLHQLPKETQAMIKANKGFVKGIQENPIENVWRKAKHFFADDSLSQQEISLASKHPMYALSRETFLKSTHPAVMFHINDNHYILTDFNDRQGFYVDCGRGVNKINNHSVFSDPTMRVKKTDEEIKDLLCQEFTAEKMQLITKHYSQDLFSATVLAPLKSSSSELFQLVLENHGVEATEKVPHVTSNFKGHLYKKDDDIYLKITFYDFRLQTNYGATTYPLPWEKAQTYYKLTKDGYQLELVQAENPQLLEYLMGNRKFTDLPHMKEGLEFFGVNELLKPKAAEKTKTTKTSSATIQKTLATQPKATTAGAEETAKPKVEEPVDADEALDLPEAGVSTTPVDAGPPPAETVKKLLDTLDESIAILHKIDESMDRLLKYSGVNLKDYGLFADHTGKIVLDPDAAMRNNNTPSSAA